MSDMANLASILAPLMRHFKPPAAKKTSPKKSAVSAKDVQKDKDEREAFEMLLEGVKFCQAHKWEEAVGAFQESFISYRKIDDRKSSSLCQKIITLVLQHIRDPKEARAAYVQARRLLKQASMLDEEARVTMFSAEYEATQTNYAEAYNLFRVAVSQCREIDDHKGLVAVLTRYAALEESRGKAAEAKKLLAEAAEVAATMSLRRPQDLPENREKMSA